MSDLFQVGDRVVTDHQLPTLLQRYQLMPQLVREIIIDRALETFPQEQGWQEEFTCTDEEKQEAIENFYQQKKLDTEEKRQAWREQQGITPEQVEAIAIRPLLIDKFKEAKWGNRVESHFLKRKNDLDQVVYSLIRIQDYGLAQEIYFRIQEGEQSFSELAREYSKGPEARTGGLLGPVSLSQPHPMLAKLLSISQPGQLWAPRKLAQWFLIIRLEKYIPAQLDDAMRRRMIDELFENWLQEEIKNNGKVQLLDSSSVAS